MVQLPPSGENFPGALIGRQGPLRFNSTRAVQAVIAHEAGTAAFVLSRIDAGRQWREDIQPSADARIVFEYSGAVEADEGAAMADPGSPRFAMEAADLER